MANVTGGGFKEFISGILTIARRSSWTLANGLAGAAIVGVAFLWPGSLPIVPNEYRWVIQLNWFFSFVLYAAIAWGILFLIQLVFVAPYRLWKGERDERARMQAGTETPRQRQIIEHDRKLAARFRELFPENSKIKLESDLLNQDAYWDTQFNQLSDVTHFLDSAEAHFLTEELQSRAHEFKVAGSELLHFLAYTFFVYPKDRRESPLYFAMQPNLNLDREGNGSEEQSKKYDLLTSRLERHVTKFAQTFDALIRAFHRELFE